MKIILASTSPRRQQLLKDIGFTFEIHPPTSAELEIKGEAPKKMVARLALEKAENVSQRILNQKKCLIIAADTIVVSPNGKKTLGKPVDALDAERILRSISGRTHRVYTAYCLLLLSNKKIKKKWSAVVATKVQMKKLTRAQIKNYVLSGEPMDKAGAYGAQGIGMCLIESIHGSYTNVVGLPMSELVYDLKTQFKITPNWDQKK